MFYFEAAYCGVRYDQVVVLQERSSQKEEDGEVGAHSSWDQRRGRLASRLSMMSARYSRFSLKNINCHISY
jgi:hypothetical protein